MQILEVMPDTPKLDEVLEFVDNPEPRCPCILLLDTSDSMQGLLIDTLNEGLRTLKDDLTKHPIASKRIEVAVITFNNTVNVVQDFVTVDKFEPPTLSAQGSTRIGAGIYRALDLLQARKAQYRSNGVAYYRPWIFMMTNSELQGEQSNSMKRVTQRIKEDEANKRVAFFAVGGEKANIERLGQIAVRTPIKLQGLNLTELFLGLSVSMSYQVAFKCSPTISSMLKLAA